MSSLCKDVGSVPVFWVSDEDYSPPTPAQSVLLPTSDSTQNLCPGSPGTSPTSGLWMTANAWRGQIEITVHGASYSLRTVYPLLQFHLIVMHPGVSVSFVTSLVPNPNATYRGCSSVSGSPGDISWYFLPTPRRSQVALQSFTFLQV